MSHSDQNAKVNWGKTQKKDATLENQSISILQYTDHRIPDILPDLRIDKIVFQKIVSYFFWKKSHLTTFSPSRIHASNWST